MHKEYFCTIKNKGRPILFLDYAQAKPTNRFAYFLTTVSTSDFDLSKNSICILTLILSNICYIQDGR